MKRNLLISWIFILFDCLSVMAQKNETALPNVELFLGAELHYRDIYYNRMYVSIRPRACFFPLFSFLPLWLHYNLNPLCVQY